MQAMNMRYAYSKPLIRRPNASRIGANRRSVQVRSQFSFETQPPRSRSRSPPHEYREDEEMRALRERLYDDPDCQDIETPQLNRLYWSLREYSHQCGARADYDEAQRSLVLSNSVCDVLRARERGEDGASAGDTQSGNVTAEWRKKFNDYDAETKKRLDEVDERHKKQREEFERLWREDMPRRYRKPSQKLLQVKRIEKSLAVSSQFEEAKRVHAEAAAIAAQEREQQQANLNRDYAVAKAKLEEKQKGERNQMEQTRRDGRRLLNVRAQQDKATAQNRSFVVEEKKKEILKGSRMADRARSSLNGNAYVTAYERSSTEDVLLDPLMPPNDPEMLEQERKRKKEMNKKKRDYHHQHAAATLAKLTVSQKYTFPNERASRERGQDETKEEETKSVAVEAQMTSSGSYEEESAEKGQEQEPEQDQQENEKDGEGEAEPQEKENEEPQEEEKSDSDAKKDE